MNDTLDWIDDAIATDARRQLITANLNSCMVAANSPALRQVAADTTDTAVIADGMPMVWASRRTPRPLPERVAGSELIFRLAERAAVQGHRVFLLGGSEPVLAETACRLTAQYHGLQIAGTASPPYRDLTDTEDAALCDQIRESGTDILLAALGQPKGELWLAERRERTGAKMSIQLGASFDFVAGRVKRAPVLVQKTGMEWAFRLAMEPRRLVGRYAANAAFLARQCVGSAALS